VEKIEELIKLAQSGDEMAMQEIISEYKYIVSSVARGYFIIGGEKEDLIQEGMAGLFKAIITFDTSKDVSFKTYATRLIERDIISAIRKSHTSNNEVLSEAIYVETDDFSSEDNPELDIISEESYKELYDIILKSLSDFEGTVVTYYLKGYSYVDIAKKLGETPKSIDNALTRIKKKLQFLKERL